jgi:hypothetical protein
MKENLSPFGYQFCYSFEKIELFFLYFDLSERVLTITVESSRIESNRVESSRIRP